MNEEQFAKGHKIRSEVMGAKYVDKSVEDADDFMRPMLELTTEYCWGEVWSRDDLSRKTRSLLNIVMLTALGKPTELGGHIRGAINNGVTVKEIRGAILHAAIYCGIPAGIDSARTAHKVLKELGEI